MTMAAKKKTRRMGGSGLFSDEATGADMLAAAAGAAPVAPPAKAPPAARAPRANDRENGADLEFAEPNIAPVERFATTTFRIKQDHMKALHAEAQRRAGIRGHNKPDASEIVRELLDAWIKRRNA